MANPQKMPLGEDRLFFVASGIIYCVVCAPSTWTAEQVAAEATRKSPPGTSVNEWVVSPPRGRDDKWNNINSMTCEDDPSRTHWLLNC